MTSALIFSLLPFAGLVADEPSGQGVAVSAAQVEHLISAAHETQDQLLRQSLTLEIWRAQSDNPRASALIDQYQSAPKELQGLVAQRAAADALVHLSSSPSFQLDVEDYRIGTVYDGDFDGPFTRIHPKSGVWALDVSDEILGMARTLRTAVVTQELATHHGHVLGWNVELVESAAFLSGTSVYIENGGIGWSKYQSEALPDVDLSLEESVKWLDSNKDTNEGAAGHLSDWLEEQRTES